MPSAPDVKLKASAIGVDDNGPIAATVARGPTARRVFRCLTASSGRLTGWAATCIVEYKASASKHTEADSNSELVVQSSPRITHPAPHRLQIYLFRSLWEGEGESSMSLLASGMRQ